ncbi:MAG: biotin transporter BioY [Thermoleophilia bacterium]|nr:biotin transporter BioY [Thermoleophilia bacterium]
MVDGAAPRALGGCGSVVEVVHRPAVVKLGLVLAGMGVLTAGALCSVPFYPVPLTMQTLAVLVVGGLLGPRLGASAVAGYLALGLAGAPVFHGGLSGPAVLTGPTGGYLVGFLAAVSVMGFAASRVRRSGSAERGGRVGVRDASWLREIAVLAGGALLAEAAIYTFGVPWLAFYTGGLGNAVAAGLVPFLLGDALKTAVAIGAVRGGRRLLSRWSLLPF